MNRTSSAKALVTEHFTGNEAKIMLFVRCGVMLGSAPGRRFVQRTRVSIRVV
jgi:hypothetical protein